jgi:hypothetical protein
MGRAKRNPSRRIDGFRFALPILHVNLSLTGILNSPLFVNRSAQLEPNACRLLARSWLGGLIRKVLKDDNEPIGRLPRG